MRPTSRLILPVTLLGMLSCGTEYARVPVTLGGTPATKSIALPAKARALFPVHAESFSYSGKNEVLLQVEVLRADKVVASVDCTGFSMEKQSGGGCGGTAQLNTECAAEVPEGGADAVRVSVRLKSPENKVEFEGLAVGIRIKE